MRVFHPAAWTAAALLALALPAVGDEEAWSQSRFDSRRSGDAVGRRVELPLGLLAAIPMRDAVMTSPVVAGGLAYVVDASGVATCIDTRSFEVKWRYETPGGTANCNNVSSPALADGHLHFGTAVGRYVVLDALRGTLVREILCDAPIWSSPVVEGDRVYFATLGAKVYALKADGTMCWTWDFVKEVLKFSGDRWNGEEWSRHREGRLTQNDRFLGYGELAVWRRTVILPAGGTVVWLEDRGGQALARALHRDPTSGFGMAVGEDGSVYQQGYVVDNAGSVRILKEAQGKAAVQGEVPGTGTSTRSSGLISFGSAALRGQDVFRTRPQGGFGLSRHSPGRREPEILHSEAALASPIVVENAVVIGDLRGNVHVIPLDGGKRWSFKTPFGKAITAPVAVAEGRIYVGCEDGYLYVLGPNGGAPSPAVDLELSKIRSPLSGDLADSRHDRFTSFGDFANTNANDQAVRPPFKIKWIRRYEGTTKHFSTCGGGRLYTHTAEGQIFAVEAESGRLLWRTYSPEVHLSHTSPLYHEERLLVPQAGPEKCVLRCLDAATGRLLWEAPFSGSPGWTRQAPPVVHKNLAVYAFSTGRYGVALPTERRPRLGWLFSVDGFSGYPTDYRPLVRAYDLASGKTVWERDFSEHGSGGDEGGVCLMDGTIYYSCFFGRSPQKVRGSPGSSGLTAAIEPATGRVRWLNKEYATTGHCTISAMDGRLYLGGFNPQAGSQTRLVVCLDAKDGTLLWKSDPIGGLGTTPVVTVGPRFIHAHSQNSMSVLLEKSTGRVLARFAQGSRCTRFTLSEPYLFGANLDVFDLSDPDAIRLVASGPRFDVSQCNGAFVSNGRIFATGQASGIQISQVYGPEALRCRAPWER